MSQPTPTLQVLQVFSGGRPCGWLGSTPGGFWFHYAGNGQQQPWASLLMPPTQNFYQQAELFPVFEQHLPMGANADPQNAQQALHQLQQHSGQALGPLTFANPDAPVVKPPLTVPPPLAPGQSALVSSQARKPFANMQVHHPSTWPLVQQLRELKKQVDPQNRLIALRWATEAELSGSHVWHPRPNLDPYHQQLLGFERINSLLNVSLAGFMQLAQQGRRFELVLHELARSFCKHFAAEIALLQHLLPWLINWQLQAYVVYRASPAGGGFAEVEQTPQVMGLQYVVAGT
ncbi:HipA N-terminal domain-containing protein [Limnobacter sp.]|uniref:HipA N-terminal domain-containing protein n=1 Tax=Limnobacter sp. TaxID=2003368 RepID=UPI003516EA46